MKKHVSFILCLLSYMSFGQTFEGYTTDDYKSYHCLLQIQPDSSITFIYNQTQNTVYAEFVGHLRKKTDSTYLINAELAIGQFMMKSFDPDTFYIQLAPQIAVQLDKIEIEYTNHVRQLLQGYDRIDDSPYLMLKIPINATNFNASDGKNTLKITINRKNGVTHEWVSFTIHYGSAAYIISKAPLELEVSLKNGIVKSVGKKPLQTGHFILKKVTLWFPLH